MMDSLKAFDMVGDTSIFKTLNDFGFELKCINIIKMISDDLILNAVGLPKLTSPKLKVQARLWCL